MSNLKKVEIFPNVPNFWSFLFSGKKTYFRSKKSDGLFILAMFLNFLSCSQLIALPKCSIVWLNWWQMFEISWNRLIYQNMSFICWTSFIQTHRIISTNINLLKNWIADISGIFHFKECNFFISPTHIQGVWVQKTKDIANGGYRSKLPKIGFFTHVWLFWHRIFYFAYCWARLLFPP